jgi:hypothetical protein
VLLLPDFLLVTFALLLLLLLPPVDILLLPPAELRRMLVPTPLRKAAADLPNDLLLEEPSAFPRFCC